MASFTLPGQWRIDLLPARSYQAAYTPKTAIIGFAFDGQIGVHAFGSDRRTDFRARPNGLAFVPAGCDVYSASDRGGEYLTIAPMENESCVWPAGYRFSDVVDRRAIAAAESLRRLLLSGADCDPLRYEPFVQVLQDLATGVVLAGRNQKIEALWMTPQRLRRIDDLIEAEIESRLTVQTLADHLGLSAGFFSRAFKAAIGKAPHDYIVDRRVARARALLRDERIGLAAVAAASGFASHAHMTSTFRSRLGLAPSDLRHPY